MSRNATNVRYLLVISHMGVSENSVPLNPMVNDHYPNKKWLFHWEYTLFSDKPTWRAGKSTMWFDAFPCELVASITRRNFPATETPDGVEPIRILIILPWSSLLPSGKRLRNYGKIHHF